MKDYFYAVAAVSLAIILGIAVCLSETFSNKLKADIQAAKNQERIAVALERLAR